MPRFKIKGKPGYIQRQIKVSKEDGNDYQRRQQYKIKDIKKKEQGAKKTNPSQTKEEIINVLSEFKQVFNSEFYAVGGAVRDLLLNRKPKDLDIASPIKPKDLIKKVEELKSPDIKAIDVGGEKFGTVLLLYKGREIEHTTFRKEIIPGRKPKVEFTDNLLEDLKRRDFTLNAIAMNEKGEFIDPYGGIKDIAERKIRAVGNPEQRFKEDLLRIIRGLRFAVELDFEIERNTFAAMKRLAPLVEKEISAQRIKMEVNKVRDNPEKLRLLLRYMADLGIQKEGLEAIRKDLVPKRSEDPFLYSLAASLADDIRKIQMDYLHSKYDLLREEAKIIYLYAIYKKKDPVKFYSLVRQLTEKHLQMLKKFDPFLYTKAIEARNIKITIPEGLSRQEIAEYVNNILYKNISFEEPEKSIIKKTKRKIKF